MFPLQPWLFPSEVHSCDTTFFNHAPCLPPPPTRQFFFGRAKFPWLLRLFHRPPFLLPGERYRAEPNALSSIHFVQLQWQERFISAVTGTLIHDSWQTEIHVSKSVSLLNRHYIVQSIYSYHKKFSTVTLNKNRENTCMRTYMQYRTYIQYPHLPSVHTMY